jgi:trimeric autotransporter adhesin
MIYSASQMASIFGLSDGSIDTSSIGTGGVADIPIRKPRGFDTPAVIAPWQDRTISSTPLDQKIGRIRSQKSVIDSNASVLRTTGNNADLKSTFTIFKALDDLKALADYASDKKRTSAERAQLSALFEKGLKDVQAFSNTTATRQLNLLFGDKATRAESILVSKPPSGYTGIGVVANNKTTEIKGLAATDTINIALTKSSGGVVVQTDSITVDFSGITAPITLDKALERINARIIATPQKDINGDPVLDTTGKPIPAYATRFELATDSSGKFGLRITTSTTETATLSDAAAAPAAFVVANYTDKASISRDGIGRFSRIDSPASGTPAQSVLATIAGIDGGRSAFAKDVFATLAQPTRTTAPRLTAPGDTTTATKVNATAIDSKGFVYTVGTLRGDIDIQQGDSRSDLFLSKYDSNGVLLYARKIGAAGESGGASLAIDSNDNVIVAGQTTANLSLKNILRGEDTLVAKFSSDGTEIFAVALDSLAADRATAVAVDANGDIFLGGQVTGALPNQIGQGGQDAMLMKLSGIDGALQARHQFGTGDTDSLAGLAVRSDGRIATASTENGQVVVRLFDGADIAAGSLQSQTLGTGTAQALGYDASSNSLVMAGTTASGLSGISGFSGGYDGFVVTLDATLATSGGAHVGSSSSDYVDSLSIASGKIFLGGRTTGTLGDKKMGKTDAFVAQFDLATLTRDSITQFGEADATASQVVLTAAAKGPGTLAKLGLRMGDAASPVVSDLMNATSLRAGDHFFVSVDGRSARKIDIAANETFKSLASKLRTTFGRRIDVRVTESSAGSKFEIRQKDDSKVELRSGADGKDALTKLGMAPTKLLANNVLFNLSGETNAKKDVQRPGGTFNLGLTLDLHIADENSAQYVSRRLGEAAEKIQSANRSLYFDEFRARTALRAGASGPVPAYLQRQNANLLAGLERLIGGQLV